MADQNWQYTWPQLLKIYNIDSLSQPTFFFDIEPNLGTELFTYIKKQKRK